MNIKLNNNMSKSLVTVSEDMMVEEALMIMKSHNFRHLPVVNSKNEIIGFVSDRDLYKNLNSDKIELSQIMVKDIYKVDVKTSMKVVVQKMIAQKISAFLVEKNGEVLGIITSEDMLQLLAQLLNEENEGLTLFDDFLQAVGVTDLAKNPNLVT